MTLDSGKNRLIETVDGTSNGIGMITARGSSLQTPTVAITCQTAAIERATIVTGTAIKATAAPDLTIPVTDIPDTISVSSRPPGPRFSKARVGASDRAGQR